MGLNDQEIVVLSGAHTMGRCHMTRSGYDGPWTNTPLTFNNEYFINLMDKEWQPRVWDGPFQYEDVETKSMMMLPSDMAIRTDEALAPFARKYADDAALFADDFSAAFAKLLALNCPPSCSDTSKGKSEAPGASAQFRENAMHGSIEKVMQFKDAGADVHSVDPASGRSALHFAAFWGHTHVIDYLIGTCGLDVNVQDSKGDTPLHDAARFAHHPCCAALMAANADMSILNTDGYTPLQVAVEYSSTSTAHGHEAVIELLQSKA
jgi:hypothetical protein